MRQSAILCPAHGALATCSSLTRCDEGLHLHPSMLVLEVASGKPLVHFFPTSLAFIMGFSKSFLQSPWCLLTCWFWRTALVFLHYNFWIHVESSFVSSSPGLWLVLSPTPARFSFATIWLCRSVVNPQTHPFDPSKLPTLKAHCRLGWGTNPGLAWTVLLLFI